MALLAFDDCSNSPVGSLLDHAQRQKTASELNAAILAAQYQEKGMSGHYVLFPTFAIMMSHMSRSYEFFNDYDYHVTEAKFPPIFTRKRVPCLIIIVVPKLPILLKMLLWAQTQLEERVKFPKITNFVTAQLEEPEVPMSSS